MKVEDAVDTYTTTMLNTSDRPLDPQLQGDPDCSLTAMPWLHIIHVHGRIAQLVRAPRLHRGGHRFESCFAHVRQAFASLAAVE